MVKELARAFRWREMLENGTDATIAEIALPRKSMVLRWPGPAAALLAPDMVEAVLNGRQSPGMTLAVLMRRFPMGWKEQRAKFPQIRPEIRSTSDVSITKLQAPSAASPCTPLDVREPA